MYLRSNVPWRKCFKCPASCHSRRKSKPWVGCLPSERLVCMAALFIFCSTDFAHSTGSRLGVIGEQGLEMRAMNTSICSSRVINVFT